jgi:hypothetical protein
MKVDTKIVFGQNDISSLDTYFEYVKKGRDNQLDIRVAGPEYFDNNMAIEGYEEEGLLKAFQPTAEYHEKVVTINDLAGHSLTAFYQEARLIGFQRR